MSLVDDAVRLLTGWQPPDADQDALRGRYLAHLSVHRDGVFKDGPPEHLTASCLVLDPSGTRTLLVHHAKGGFWVQPGGHCEPSDATLAQAAAREAREELGITDLAVHPVPVQLDRHELSAAFGRCSAHLDVRFLAVAPADAVPVPSAESRAVGWSEVDHLPASAVPDLVAALGRARSVLSRS